MNARIIGLAVATLFLSGAPQANEQEMPIRRPSTNNYNLHQSWAAAETRYSFFHLARRLEIECPQLPSWESRMGDERRRTPRYPFIATAEVIEQGSNASISARVSELSLHGCHIDMPNPLPQDAAITVKIYSEGKFFEAAGTVVYSQPNLGFGVSFRGIRPQFLSVLKQWLLAAAVAKYGPKP